MSNFIVSFRIERDGTYQERYESLLAKVKDIATGYIWDETTSLYVFPAPGDAASVARDLYLGSKLTSRDALLVVDPIRSQQSSFGVKYPALLGAAIGMPHKIGS